MLTKCNYSEKAYAFCSDPTSILLAMVDLPRHFVEIQHHLNKMHKPYSETPVPINPYQASGSDQKLDYLTISIS